VKRRIDAWFLAAAVGLLALAGTGAALILLTADPEPPQRVAQLRSYYFEATVTASQSPLRTVKGWYLAPDKLRLEVAEAGKSPSVYLIDGGVMRVYDAASNTYDERPKPDDALKLNGNTTLLVGPLPAATLAEYFDGLEGGTWNVAGEEKLLGRRTEVVERDLRTVSEGTIARYWLDPRYLFVLRYESNSRNAGTTWEVTRVDYNTRIAPEVFVFQAPPGARKLETPSLGGGSGARPNITSYSLPPGFLRPAYVPDGYVAAVIGQSVVAGGGGSITTVTVRFYGPRAAGADTVGYMVIEQTLGGQLQRPADSQEADVNGAPGYRSEAGGRKTLAWTVPTPTGAGVVVSLTSNVLGFDELLKVAKSMK
jgi:outer membrane lipoprotein-sorting protein